MNSNNRIPLSESVNRMLNLKFMIWRSINEARALKKIRLKISILFIFIGYSNFAQIGLPGDVYIASNEVIAVHSPETHFFEGIIHSDAPGQLSFLKDNHGIGAHSSSHIEAKVESIETQNFIFPVVDAGVYQPLKIDSGTTDNLTVDLDGWIYITY